MLVAAPSTLIILLRHRLTADSSDSEGGGRFFVLLSVSIFLILSYMHACRKLLPVDKDVWINVKTGGSRKNLTEKSWLKVNLAARIVRAQIASLLG